MEFVSAFSVSSGPEGGLNTPVYRPVAERIAVPTRRGRGGGGGGLDTCTWIWDLDMGRAHQLSLCKVELCSLFRFHSFTYRYDEVSLRMRKGEKVWDERPLPQLLQDYASCDVLHLHRLYAELRKRQVDLLAPTLRLAERYIMMYTLREGTEFDDPRQINSRWMKQCLKDEADKNKPRGAPW